MLGDAFKAQAAYGHEVAALLDGRPAPDVETLRRKARAIRIDAQKLVAAAAIEPKWGRRDHLESTSEQLAALAEGGAQMLFVHAQALSSHGRGVTSSAALRETLAEAIQRAEAHASP